MVDVDIGGEGRQSGRELNGSGIRERNARIVCVTIREIDAEAQIAGLAYSIAIRWIGIGETVDGAK